MATAEVSGDVVYQVASGPIHPEWRDKIYQALALSNGAVGKFYPAMHLF